MRPLGLGRPLLAGGAPGRRLGFTAGPGKRRPGCVLFLARPKVGAEHCQVAAVSGSGGASALGGRRWHLGSFPQTGRLPGSPVPQRNVKVPGRESKYPGLCFS